MEATWVNANNEAIPGPSLAKFVNLVVKNQPKYSEKDLMNTFGIDPSDMHPVIRIRPSEGALENMDLTDRSSSDEDD